MSHICDIESIQVVVRIADVHLGLEWAKVFQGVLVLQILDDDRLIVQEVSIWLLWLFDCSFMDIQRLIIITFATI